MPLSGMEPNDDWVADRCDDFEDAWHDARETKQTPDLGAFISSINGSADPDQLTMLLSDLVQIDMEFRARFTPNAVEPFSNYLQRFGQLDGSHRVELAVCEFRVRQMWGDKPALEAFIEQEQLPATIEPRLYRALQEIEPLEIVVTPSGSEESLCQLVFDCATELGRQRVGESGPTTTTFAEGVRRVIIAPLRNRRVSRRHLTLKRTTARGLNIRNMMRKGSLVADTTRLGPDEFLDCEAPISVNLGDFFVRVRLLGQSL